MKKIYLKLFLVVMILGMTQISKIASAYYFGICDDWDCGTGIGAKGGTVDDASNEGQRTLYKWEDLSVKIDVVCAKPPSIPPLKDEKLCNATHAICKITYVGCLTNSATTAYCDQVDSSTQNLHPDLTCLSHINPMDACRDANHFEQDLPSACASNNNLLINVCGDGVQANNESCDDHNTNNNDGCSSNCATEAGWTCTGQPSVCKVMFIMKSLSLSAICGDGKVDQGEDCDDNNTTPGDGCSTTCTIESGYTCDKSQTPSVCTPTTVNPPLNPNNPNDPNNPNYDPNSKIDKTDQHQGVENSGDAQKDSSGNTMEMSGGGWTCSFHPEVKSEAGASSGMVLALVGLPLLGWVIRKKLSASNK